MNVRVFTLAAVLCLGLPSSGETLIDGKGRKIEAEIGEIGKVEVHLTVNGKVFWVSIASLSAESREMLGKMKAARAKAELEETEAKKKAAEAENKAHIERKTAAQKVGAEFRGLWLGMSEADREMAFKSAPFVKGTANLWNPVRGQQPGFEVLAENAAGEKFTWNYVFTFLKEGKVAELSIASPEFELKEFSGAFSDWILAVRKAIIQKHGEPDYVWPGEFKLIDVPDGADCRLAVWKLAGNARAELTVGRNEDYKYTATVTYYDADVRAKEKAAKEKVKGKL